ncbi:t-SNARE [Patellaria atrata CBS 101060]|uniref:t-SNARE n=1 Tax=Patellaria atrata CBS 101060 TaxID=1346257 RepID=A0A9P4VS99_9PEZI|nr:t-SNARE [Patellaria atrata CBS 101060]
MSYGNYQQYGGNPYGESGENGYGASNPYGGSYTTSNQNIAAPQLTHETSNYSQPSQYSEATPMPTQQQYQQQQQQPSPLQQQQYPQSQPTILSNQDFLARINATKSDIQRLTSQIAEIGTLHQRALSATDSGSSAALEHQVTQTQILNTRIKDQIKALETDAARSGRNVTKDSQVRTLKQTFKAQLEDFQREESEYRKRYQEQIARQYRIVNPEASEDEVAEAARADWGDEGVFQTALKSNRTGHATSVLGAVRARHNDIQKIEQTLLELSQLFAELAEAVVVQEEQIVQTEEQTHQVIDDTEQGNKQLDQGIKSARRARKMKWWLLIVCVLIVAIIALALGLYFGLKK